MNINLLCYERKGEVLSFCLDPTLLFQHDRDQASNTFSLPKIFNTNISHQLFDKTITFVNSQHKNTYSKGDFVLKNQF